MDLGRFESRAAPIFGQICSFIVAGRTTNLKALFNESYFLHSINMKFKCYTLKGTWHNLPINRADITRQN